MSFRLRLTAFSRSRLPHHGLFILPPLPCTSRRLYAYASSAVQWGILKLFVRCDVLLPNLFVGTITRESVMHALRLGITADDVVAYLRDNAHPRVSSNVPVVPGVRLEGACERRSAEGAGDESARWAAGGLGQCEEAFGRGGHARSAEAFGVTCVKWRVVASIGRAQRPHRRTRPLYRSRLAATLPSLAPSTRHRFSPRAGRL